MTTTARSGTDEPVARLMERMVDDGTDRMRWLRARQGTITATMAKELVRGGAGARRRIVAASFEDPREIHGNRYVDRGHAREPWIAEWIAARWMIRSNVALLRSAENPRHTATPDGIGVVMIGGVATLVLAEIKTSKHDLDPRAAHYGSTGYAEQMQWQMYVTGAVATLFVWEQHDDAWPDPQPLDLEPRFVWVQRDDAMIARMIASADLALVERDRVATGEDGQTVEDVELEGLALAVLDAREEGKAAEARLKTPWTRMLTLLERRPSWSQASGLALITWRNDTRTDLKPDRDAAMAAHVDGEADDVTGGDLLADLARAQDAWDRHQARFTKPVEVGTRHLTVTAPKAVKR